MLLVYSHLLIYNRHLFPIPLLLPPLIPLRKIRTYALLSIVIKQPPRPNNKRSNQSRQQHETPKHRSARHRMLHHRALYLRLLSRLMIVMCPQMTRSVKVRDVSLVPIGCLSVTHPGAAWSRGRVGCGVGLELALLSGFAFLGMFTPPSISIERWRRAAEVGASPAQSRSRASACRAREMTPAGVVVSGRFVEV